MRRFFIIVMSLALSIGVNAQELKRTEPDFSDYIPLLKAAGYEVYTFDISSLKDNTYNLSFVIREYAKGERVSGSDNDVVSFTVASRRMISELPEASQKQLLAEDKLCRILINEISLHSVVYFLIASAAYAFPIFTQSPMMSPVRKYL